MTEGTRIAGAKAGRRTVRALAVLSIVGVTGCSSVPDAVNPVEWYRGTSDTVGGWFGGESSKDGKAPPEPNLAGDPGSSNSTQYPNLSTVPERPTPSTTAEQRETLKQGLVADRANARYTEQPAGQTAPPAQPTRNKPAAQSPAPVSRSEPESRAVPPSAPAEPQAAAPASPRPQAAAPVPQASQQSSRLGAGSGAQSALWPNRPAPATPNITAVTSGEVGGEHVRRAEPQPEPAAMPARAAVAPPSAAPQSTSQLAERTTLDSAGTASRAPAPRPEPAAARQPSPAASSQSVIVNVDAIDAVPASASFSGQPYLASTVYFAHGSAGLTGTERQELSQIAKTAASTGAAIRVVGHASARTADLNLRAHEVANFEMSLKRANAVAEALIRAGVTANRIQIDALGDSQPEFYEVMPSGEAGNRRVEVFLIY